MSQLRPLFTIGVFALPLFVAACGGGDAPNTEGAATSETTPAAAPAAAPASGAGALPAGVTAEMVSAGQALFPTQICASCHGPDARGLEGLGPNLVDATWLNSDGSFEQIVQTITNGVPQPRSVPVMMPPKGGNAALTDAQIRDLAAWIYSVSHAM
jgi:mono/diheme cytochrome c family protein